jgi:hypothetical protein
MMSKGKRAEDASIDASDEGNERRQNTRTVTEHSPGPQSINPAVTRDFGTIPFAKAEGTAVKPQA